MQVMKERRSIRKFQEGVIPKEDLNKILEAGRLAPSAKNKQPWELVIMEDKKMQNNIAEELVKVLQQENPTSEAIKTASIVIMVFNPLEMDDFNIMSIGASIENMLLEATHLGYGSLWIGLTKNIESYIKGICNQEHPLMATICLGYKEETPESRPRKSMEEYITYLKKSEEM